jgi:hypothetical protein
MAQRRRHISSGNINSNYKEIKTHIVNWGVNNYNTNKLLIMYCEQKSGEALLCCEYKIAMVKDMKTSFHGMSKL